MVTWPLNSSLNYSNLKNTGIGFESATPFQKTLIISCSIIFCPLRIFLWSLYADSNYFIIIMILIFVSSCYEIKKYFLQGSSALQFLSKRADKSHLFFLSLDNCITHFRICFPNNNGPLEQKRGPMWYWCWWEKTTTASEFGNIKLMSDKKGVHWRADELWHDANWLKLVIHGTLTQTCQRAPPPNQPLVKQTAPSQTHVKRLSYRDSMY